MHLKKFTCRFGVIKINIYSARAHEIRCDHFTPPPTKLGLRKKFAVLFHIYSSLAQKSGLSPGNFTLCSKWQIMKRHKFHCKNVLTTHNS